MTTGPSTDKPEHDASRLIELLARISAAPGFTHAALTHEWVEQIEGAAARLADHPAFGRPARRLLTGPLPPPLIEALECAVELAEELTEPPRARSRRARRAVPGRHARAGDEHDAPAGHTGR